MDTGIQVIFPTLAVIASAVLLKRALEPLAIGCLVGYVMLSGGDFAGQFLDGILKSMGDETVRWILFVVALFGAIIALLVRSGGANAFARSLVKYVKSKRDALLVTWGLGLLIFIDDYLNALAVGSAMRRVTDKLKISREMLAYVVDTTAAPVCILLPFSTWAIYVSGLLESNGVAETNEGLKAYLNVIPYMIYAWVALLMPPLLALGKIPLIGGLKTAQLRAQSGDTAPEGYVEDEEIVPPNPNGEQAINFILPMLSLIVFTWLFDVDILKGAAVTLFLTIVMFKVRGVFTFHEVFDTAVNGVRHMVEVMMILVLSFVLKDVNDQLQLTAYVIDLATSYVNPLALPVIAFVSLSTIAFCTGTFWGLYAVALPIIVPLAQSIQVDMNLMIGAVISAGAFGSHACFYSDSTVLSAKGSGCPPIQHALTQLPYAVTAGVITAIVLIVLSLFGH